VTAAIVKLSDEVLNAPVRLHTGSEIPRVGLYLAVIQWLERQAAVTGLRPPVDEKSGVRHNQATWISRDPECGTSCCVAGFVKIAVTGETNQFAAREYAKEALGLTGGQASVLFSGGNPRPALIRRLRALSGLVDA
jgi:hypothetical protein